MGLNICMHRLGKELRDFSKDPIDGIKVVPRAENVSHLDAEIAGATGSPYDGGIFQLEMLFPKSYPRQPPNVRFLTKIYHPNIDRKGEICLDILRENWTAAYGIVSILLSIQCLLGDPNPADPLDVEIGRMWTEDEVAAVNTAAEWTKLYATPRSEMGSGPNALSKKPMVPFTGTAPRCDGAYQYEKLQGVDETRLLRLHPGTHNDAIVGTIENAVLPACSHASGSQLLSCALCATLDTPVYEALSYAWGEQRVSDTIYIRSRQEGVATSLGIAFNCAQALRRLRLSDRDRLIWVDAICINQGDLSERSSQVRIMHRIYKTASRVLVYLGEGSASTHHALSILTDDVNGRRSNVMDNPTEPEIQSLLEFFQLPWFKRVWVLQEVAWSKSALVICGSKVTPWRENVSKAYISSISTIETLQPLPYVLKFGEGQSDKLVMTPEALFSELKNARHCEASDPRDKIFALLELFPNRPEDKRLVIDYERGIPDLYTDVSEYLLENLGVDVLAERYNGSRMQNLPSWVIDWTVPPNDRPYHFHRCSAGGHAPENSSLTMLGRDRIKVRAAQLCSIYGSISLPELLTARSIAKYPTTTGGASTQAFDNPMDAFSIDRLLDQIARIEGEGPLEPSEFDPRINDLLDDAAFWKKWDPKAKKTKQMLPKLRNRKVFVTLERLPLLGPTTARSGDEIFVLEGGSMCHVLRRTAHDNVYVLVGDCFLAGHMHMPEYGYGPAPWRRREVSWRDIAIM